MSPFHNILLLIAYVIHENKLLLIRCKHFVKIIKKIVNSLSIMEERICPKIEPVSQSLQTPSTQQRNLIVDSYCIQEVDPLKYRSGSGSGSRNLIFNGSGSRLFKTLGSGSVQVQLHQNLKVRVRFRFNDFKFKQFRFGLVRLPAGFKLI